jgi:predicted ester cyclase
MHTQSFDARPKVRTVIGGDGRVALEPDFVGTHTGEYLGAAPTGRPVDMAYCMMYDVQGDKIRALRCCLSTDLRAQQISGTD